MLDPVESRDSPFITPFKAATWMPEVDRVGREQIPVLRPPTWHGPPDRLVAFDKRHPDKGSSAAFLHFYVADRKLAHILQRPQRYLHSFASYAGLISPDFSLYRSMPPHQRVLHTWANRAVGAYYQAHGLAVIANVRWATQEDFAFCFLGVPVRSVVAISMHGCSRNSEDRYHFRTGLAELLDQIEPHTVIVHGQMPRDVFDRVRARSDFIHFSSDINRAHAMAG